MNGRRTIETDLSDITPSALKAYADSEGWQDVEPYGDVGRIYVLNQDTPNIIIPNSMDFADYNSVLHRVIEIMANAENRDWKAVAQDLILADTNHVQIRLVDAYEDGSVPARAGVALIQHSWKMIVAAARSAWSPKPVFQGGIRSEISEYLSNVRLGQTERGSFVVNILSPTAVITDNVSSTAEAFSDRVVGTLASGLEAIRHSLPYVNEYRSGWMFEEYVQRGMSANLCEAIAGILANAGDAGLEVSVDWAIASRAYKDRARIAFDKSHEDLLERSASILKKQPEHSNFRLTGKVTSLSRRETDHYGIVTIQEHIGSNPLSVSVGLRQADYIKAYRAHPRGLIVTVTGDLKQLGRGWRLLNPGRLTILRAPQRWSTITCAIR